MGVAAVESRKDARTRRAHFQRTAIARNVERADDSSHWRWGLATCDEEAEIRRLRTWLGPKRLPREKNGGPHWRRGRHGVACDEIGRASCRESVEVGVDGH